MKCDFVSVPTHPTITKLRVLSRNQQLIRLDFEEGFEGGPAAVARAYQAGAGIDRRAGIVRLCQRRSDQRADYDFPARRAGVPVLIDPKGTDFERYRGATLLTPNLSEFEAVAGKCKAKTNWLNAA